MDRAQLLAFMRALAWAVQASTSADGAPQAAVIGVAVTESLALVFDTLGDSRKARNLRANPKVALVIGWDDGQTLQYEGLAEEPVGAALDEAKRIYFARFPDGRDRERSPGIAYFRVRPTWLRYSDFRGADPQILSWSGASLDAFVAAP